MPGDPQDDDLAQRRIDLGVISSRPLYLKNEVPSLGCRAMVRNTFDLEPPRRRPGLRTA